ncbi:DUF1972 domain-containing protein [Saccharicrinis aurantiacus]|uniref:DUF1972 domain-containing protein n=1 Tax=Saccharicrinis aurantiacus TaxID=1849719 RepID=UPI00094F6307|nr:DUF1972 domain-containing protein [Saccharicrinis aurantiacus]
MNIGIIGTRGIPNYYGGFEQFAEYLSVGLVKKGHNVTVYNSQLHPYQDSSYKGVNVIHCKDPEEIIGTAGQFIYDLNCILDSRKRNFDIILQLGYTSNSIWGAFLPNKPLIITNMDGLEWKRSKYSYAVKKFLLLAERLGVVFSDKLIADSIGIQNYLRNKYNKESTYIAYGSDLCESTNQSILSKYDVSPYNYDMLIARLEPENSIEVILDGVVKSNSKRPFLVVGKVNAQFGIKMRKKFKKYTNIRFVGGIYDINILNNLRYFANYYFHGHTVGGTNPSLLEAMGSGALIVANTNEFNQTILGDDALYFSTSVEVGDLLDTKNESRELYRKENYKKIKELYNWESIIDQYEDLFLKFLKK